MRGFKLLLFLWKYWTYFCPLWSAKEILLNVIKLSLDNYLYLESLSVSDKSNIDYSYHEKLVPANFVGFLTPTRRELITDILETLKHKEITLEAKFTQGSHENHSSNGSSYVIRGSCAIHKKGSFDTLPTIGKTSHSPTAQHSPIKGTCSNNWKHQKDLPILQRHKPRHHPLWLYPRRKKIASLKNKGIMIPYMQLAQTPTFQSRAHSVKS